MHSGRGSSGSPASARSRPDSGACRWHCPFLFVIARVSGQPVHWPGKALGILIAFAAFFFAADLAAWHIGIHMTKLGNATLFGNVASFAFAGWGLWLTRQLAVHGAGRVA